jgi:REP element-mobilizing transposase RayT
MLGEIKYARQYPAPDRERLMKFWTAAAPHLARAPLFLDDRSWPSVAAAFSKVIQCLAIKVPACAIMNDHVHILVLGSKYRIEYIVNQLKGAATSVLKLERTPWTRGCWKVFINDKETLLAAVEYINANPASASLTSQSWDFISPLPV